MGACLTSPVTPTGPQSYSLSATRCGLCEPVTGYVTVAANKYCQNLGKRMVVRMSRPTTTNQCSRGSATINFDCVAETPTEARAASVAECKVDYSSSDLDPIRHKVELYRDVVDAPAPFEIAANDQYPSEGER